MVLLPAETARKAASAEIAALRSCCQIGVCRNIPVKVYCSECRLPSCQWCYEVYRGTTIPICGECDPFKGIYVRQGRIVEMDMYRSKDGVAPIGGRPTPRANTQNEEKDEENDYQKGFPPLWPGDDTGRGWWKCPHGHMVRSSRGGVTGKCPGCHRDRAEI